MAETTEIMEEPMRGEKKPRFTQTKSFPIKPLLGFVYHGSRAGWESFHPHRQREDEERENQRRKGQRRWGDP